ncbi:MAG: Asp-tRNA(Asn)/Glu-tRNA(Gln) amidotransferase subunit GatB, partial [Gemmatimonadetes bacterium]|nr:Asp-tRNA(Asn)/Glu-tRNA(Gln) amidotransferase subunit GatB [Gemmatimonadota bacterium]
LEEDAGKSTHTESGTLVDFNRCGTPLIEIVSEPDLRSPREAYLYLRAVKQTLEYLDVSDCNMEEGSLRCDANVSLRPAGRPEFGTKTEVKNVNSFRFVEDALVFEIERQATLLEAGEQVVHETRLWDSARSEARPMRSKEESHDYRYFPEPDLEPLAVDSTMSERVWSNLPEMPRARAARLVTEHGLPAYDADVLTATRSLADYYEAVVELFKEPKEVSNWVMGEVLRLANERGQAVRLEPSPQPIAPADLAQLLESKQKGRISGSAAKEVLEIMVEHGGGNPLAIIEKHGLEQISDATALETEIDAVIDGHPDEVEAYRGGKEGLLGFFVGQVMRRTKGQANPELVNQILRRKLS